MNPIVVIGGGTAGIAAACFLAKKAHPVLLVERSARLGGRAASFHHGKMNEEIDYGQHVLMRCCTETLGLLDLLGVKDKLRFQPRLSVPVALGTDRSLLFAVPALGPFNLLPSLVHYRHLSWRERARLLRAGISLMCKIPKDEPFSAWLSIRGQKETAIRRLWDPICVATLNGHTTEVSARAAVHVFKNSFLKPHGADLGLFTAPLSRIFSRAGPFLDAHGGKVLLRSPVRRILVENSTASGIELASGEKIQVQAIIAALPPHALLPLLPQETSIDRYFTNLARIPFSPIINLHLWFDRPVMRERFLIAVESPIQAVFNVKKIHEKRETPAHIVLSQSAATEWIDRPVALVKQLLLCALEEILPTVRSASLVHTLITKFPTATIQPSPGTEALRPDQRSPVEKLFIAGDYTATGWPSTIEGAIRSGKIAAKRCLD